MNKINFFTPISYGNTSKSTGQCLLEKVDNYFYLGGKKAEVYPESTTENSERVHVVDDTSPIFETALKVVSYCTILLPLIMLVAKAILRANHNFYISHQGQVSITPSDEQHSSNPETNELQCHNKTHSGGVDRRPSCQHSAQTNKTGLEQSADRKKIEAAIKIQTFFRAYQAQIKLKKLKSGKQKESKNSTALTINPSNIFTSPKIPYVDAPSQISSIPPQPVKKFSSYSMRLEVPGKEHQDIQVNNFEDIESVLKDILDHINVNHSSVSIYFDWPTSNSKVMDRMVSFQKSSIARHLQFSISKYANRTIVIQPKPTKIEVLSEDKIHHTYANGIIEIFNSQKNFGTRIFPDGKKEQGEFRKESSELLSGYRIDINGKIEFVNPKPLAFYEDKPNESELGIFDVEEKLIVLQKTRDENYKANYSIIDAPVEDVLLKACQRPSYADGQSIINVLSHSDFNKSLNPFIHNVLSTSESEIPKVFSFSNAALLDIIKVGAKNGSITNPLKIINPRSDQHLFAKAANWGTLDLLANLIELFPSAFLESGQDVIAEFLRQGHSKYDAISLANKFNQIGGKLDDYHNLWLQVATGIQPDDAFKNEFDLLSIEQKRVIYDSAFTYNNTFIHEPADTPVTPEQYSINLMWINKSKMVKSQEFLFGDGSSFEQREKDFHERFVKPVSKWVKKNPGTPINIWVDGEMATTHAINRSREALLKTLDDTFHDLVRFRDVRSIEVVSSNPKAFREKMPVYFRVDLLRAIVADYTLEKKETNFFVYGDIDMKPLTCQELFDKKTVDFLDDYGFVMAKGGHLGFENGFQILSGTNQQFMKSHRKVIIDLSVEMAVQRPNAIKEQQIYDTYPAMITHFLDADGRYGNLKLVTRNTGDNDAKNEENKLKRFRYDRFGTTSHWKLPFKNVDIKIRDIMPRKPVRLPPSHFGF